MLNVSSNAKLCTILLEHCQSYESTRINKFAPVNGYSSQQSSQVSAVAVNGVISGVFNSFMAECMLYKSRLD